MPFLHTTETDLFYEVAGSGAPVLFIQGCGVIGAGWRPQIEALASRFACASFDNRGIGQSTIRNKTLAVSDMARDAKALLDHLQWDRAHVVGHSLGGLIAQQLAVDHPERVRSLALLCTFARGRQGARLAPWVIWMGLRTHVGSRAMRRQAFLEMVMTPSYLRTLDRAKLAHDLAPLFGRDLADQPAIVMKQVAAMAKHDIFEHLPRLSGLSVLVASARHDKIAPPRFGRAIACQIPTAHYVEWEDAAHGVTLQRPEVVNSVLREHFEASDRR